MLLRVKVSLLLLGSSFSCEYFVAGPELFFVIMKSIHKTLCFSGYHKERVCSASLASGGIEIAISHIHQKCSQFELPKLVQSLCLRESAATTLDPGKVLGKCVFSALKSNSSPTVVSVRSNFVLRPGCHTMLEVSFFSFNCVRCIPLASASKLNTFSCILFPGALVGRDSKSCTSSGCKLVNILLFTEKLASSSVKPNG